MTESKHRSQIRQKHGDPTWEAPIHVLDIPDDYQFMDPELADLVYDLVLPFLDD